MYIDAGHNEAGSLFRVHSEACYRNEVSSASVIAVLKYFTMVDQGNQN